MDGAKCTAATIQAPAVVSGGGVLGGGGGVRRSRGRALPLPRRSNRNSKGSLASLLAHPHLTTTIA